MKLHQLIVFGLTSVLFGCAGDDSTDTGGNEGTNTDTDPSTTDPSSSQTSPSSTSSPSSSSASGSGSATSATTDPTATSGTSDTTGEDTMTSGKTESGESGDKCIEQDGVCEATLADMCCDGLECREGMCAMCIEEGMPCEPASGTTDDLLLQRSDVPAESGWRGLPLPNRTRWRRLKENE